MAILLASKREWKTNEVEPEAVSQQQKHHFLLRVNVSRCQGVKVSLRQLLLLDKKAGQLCVSNLHPIPAHITVIVVVVVSRILVSSVIAVVVCPACLSDANARVTTIERRKL